MELSSPRWYHALSNTHPGHFTSSSEDSTSQQNSKISGLSIDGNSRRNVSAFKIMTVSRGFTEEGDKLLNYLVMPSTELSEYESTFPDPSHLQEHGIFDALKNQYLRSFIFAIYLVSSINVGILVSLSYILLGRQRP
jgi:HORMA domain